MSINHFVLNSWEAIINKKDSDFTFGVYISTSRGSGEINSQAFGVAESVGAWWNHIERSPNCDFGV